MEELPLAPEQMAWCRQMADLAGLGAFIVDLRSGRCLWCADEIARIHGLSVADCIQLLSDLPALLERIDPEDRDAYASARTRAIKRRRAYTIQYRLRRPDGAIRVVKETAEPTADPANGRRRLVGTLQDVTDRHAAEQALQRANELLERRLEERTAELRVAKNAARAAETAAHESQDRFLAAAEALMDGLAIYDAEDRLVFHNGRYPEHAPPSFRAAFELDLVAMSAR